jgi:hypothetical protein
MASNKRDLVCCTDDQRSHKTVRSVLGEYDKEENHGNEQMTVAVIVSV